MTILSFRLLPLPSREFLAELDKMRDEPLELHCIGGFVSRNGLLFLREDLLQFEKQNSEP